MIQGPLAFVAALAKYIQAQFCY